MAVIWRNKMRYKECEDGLLQALCMYKRWLQPETPTYCENTCQPGYKFCRYHQNGGCSLFQNTFFSFQENRFLSLTDHQPLEGDFKFRGEIIYRFDGMQWRRCCMLCEKQTKFGLYCIIHNPKRKFQCCRRGFSKLACKFIDMISKELNIDIRHAHFNEDGQVVNDEVQIPGTRYRVDGFHADTKMIIEFHGDRWHGNPRVYAPYQMDPIKKKTYRQLYKETMDRLQVLVNFGYNVYYIWEMDFKEYLKNPQGSLFLKLLKLCSS